MLCALISRCCWTPIRGNGECAVWFVCRSNNENALFHFRGQFEWPLTHYAVITKPSSSTHEHTHTHMWLHTLYALTQQLLKRMRWSVRGENWNSFVNICWSKIKLDFGRRWSCAGAGAPRMKRARQSMSVCTNCVHTRWGLNDCANICSDVFVVCAYVLFFQPQIFCFECVFNIHKYRNRQTNECNNEMRKQKLFSV